MPKEKDSQENVFLTPQWIKDMAVEAKKNLDALPAEHQPSWFRMKYGKK